MHHGQGADRLDGAPVIAAERISEQADANSHIVLETPLEHRTLKDPPPVPVAADSRHSMRAAS
jgi:hypothetical protein